MIFDIKMDGKFTRKDRLVQKEIRYQPYITSLTVVLWPDKVLDWYF